MNVEPTPTIVGMVLSGGGLRCLAFCSAISVLQSSGINPKKVVGTSGGSIIASLYAAGYSGDEMADVLSEVVPTELVSSSWGFIGDAYRLFSTYGIYSSEKIGEWVDNLIYKKTDIKNATFAQLRAATGIKLVIPATCLTTLNPVYYTASTHGSMVIKTAIRASIGYPFAFEAMMINHQFMVDGGVCDNYAIEYFIKRGHSIDTIIGLNLLSQQEHPNHRIFSGEIKISNLQDYTKAIISCLILQNERSVMNRKRWGRTIAIQTGDISALDFDLDQEEKAYLLDQGKKAAEAFLLV